MSGRQTVQVEIAGRRIRAGRIAAESGWWINPDGLDEWWDSAPTKTGRTDNPGNVGVTLSEQLVGAKTFTFQGQAWGSSYEWIEQEARPWLASLAMLPDLRFGVFASGKWLWAHGAVVDGIVRSREVTEDMITFQIPIMLPDPRKYGSTQTIEIDAVAEPVGGLRFPIVDGALDFAMEGLTEFPGVFKIENPGTAEFFPERFTIRGPLEGFTITSEQSTVEYDGPVAASDELVLTPYAGGRATLNGVDVSHNLIRADWVAVQPGETRGYLFSPVDPQPGSKLTIDYPEGAWW